MEITSEMIVSIGALLASVGTSFVVVKQKISEREAALKEAIERLSSLDTRLDKNDNKTDLVTQRQDIISNMLDPEKRERLHRSLERLQVESENLRRDVTTLQHMHNGKHPSLPKE